MLTVKCPRCLHDQCCDPRHIRRDGRTPTVVGKKKRCVYCGMTFSIHSTLQTSRIMQEGKRIAFNAPMF